jgi:ribosomal protein S27E
MRVLVNNDVIKITCPGCESVLGVEIGDIQVNDVGHGSPAQWVTCPICRQTVGVPLKNIPPPWRQTLFDE